MTRPLHGADLDVWTAGLPPEQASLAWTLAGLDLVSAAVLGEPAFRPWRVAPDGLPTDPASLTSQPAAAALDATYDPEYTNRARRPLLRLALEGNVIPTEVVPHLLSSRAVDSVVLPAPRPPGAAQPSRWQWPLRIGLIGPTDIDAIRAEVQRAGDLPTELIDVRDIDLEPGTVDLLVVESTLRDTSKQLARLRQDATAVLMIDAASDPWPQVDAQLAHVRALTGASITALVQFGPSTPDIGVILGRFVANVSHAMPFDVALTYASDRRLLVVGELDHLSQSSLPDLLRSRARELDLPMAEPPPTNGAEEYSEAEPPDVEHGYAEALPSAGDLDVLADGHFVRERYEASAAREIFERMDRAAVRAQGDRFLQAYVGPTDRPVDAPQPTGPDANVVRVGQNAVDVFIGLPEAGAISWAPVSNRQLGLTAGIDEVEVTIVMVPLVPRGDPVTASVMVPKVGRSTSARLILDLPPGRKRVEARIIALRGNRVLQTGVLRATVDGAPATIENMIVLRRDLATLDQRRNFDLSLVLNMATDRSKALIAHSDGHTYVDPMAEVSDIAGRIRGLLIDAAELRGRATTVAKRTREILIELALEGNDLFTTLETRLAKLKDPRRIQIVTARPGHFLPLELVYPRVAPAADADICGSWLAGGQDCGPTCFSGPDDDSVVCPAVFWGLSKVIERHYLDVDDQNFLLLAEPTSTRRSLPVTRAVMGASSKVAAADVSATLASLGAAATLVRSWDEWVAALKAHPTDLLMLMPHTDPTKPSLEISGKALRRSRIEPKHVTGMNDVTPVVVLFGCDTSGSQDEPAGYVARFMQKHAGVVFTSLTMLLNTHAAHLSTLLATTLLADRPRKKPLGDLVTEFRRQALQDGTLAALAITAYGDADWTV